ncbi:hypothetical protein DOTSEDRAFT_32825 [Dothistroma septosporum NZE10]|uniref:Uncharacterized protein n=1 Tax=Dothistroma septosporum (strain NZE10 / CBS 128990) TaxID=675120 RepID=N1PS07_DOTSN|nr:hypothetical protein DOTSEDRAFT_32825 [Dothistroma septosporum NZE10]
MDALSQVPVPIELSEVNPPEAKAHLRLAVLSAKDATFRSNYAMLPDLGKRRVIAANMLRTDVFELIPRLHIGFECTRGYRYAMELHRCWRPRDAPIIAASSSSRDFGLLHTTKDDYNDLAAR